MPAADTFRTLVTSDSPSCTGVCHPRGSYDRTNLVDPRRHYLAQGVALGTPPAPQPSHRLRLVLDQLAAAAIGTCAFDHRMLTSDPMNTAISAAPTAITARAIPYSARS